MKKDNKKAVSKKQIKYPERSIIIASIMRHPESNVKTIAEDTGFHQITVDQCTDALAAEGKIKKVKVSGRYVLSITKKGKGFLKK